MMLGSRKKQPVIHTLVGSHTVVRGDVEFKGGFHVDGRVEGDVRCSDDENSYLSVSEGGCIEGSVEVGKVLLNGTVKGDVICHGRLQLGATARVVGNVFYHLIEMSIGAEINGKLVHQEALGAGSAAAPAVAPALGPTGQADPQTS